MKKILKSYVFNIALVLGLSGVVLYFSLKDHYEVVLAAINNLTVSWILLIAFVILGYHAIVGKILTKLAKKTNKKYRFMDGYFNALIAALFHGITPSASGGQFIQMYVFKKQNINLSESASILWMDFIIYQATMVFTVLVLLILRFEYFYTNHSELFLLVLLGFFINSFIIVGLWVVTHFKKVYSWISSKGVSLAHKIKLVKDKEHSVKMMDAGIERFVEEATKLKQNKKLLLQIFLWNLLRLFVYYSFPILCALALGINIDPALFIDLIALTSYVSMVNAFFPVPGGSGGTETTFILMFSTVIGFTNATSTMIVWRFFTYYFIMFVGAACYMRFKYISDISKAKGDI